MSDADVKPRFRFAAVLLLALMLPIQGWAAACAQICARVQHQHAGKAIAANHAGHHDPSGGDQTGGDHCTKSDLGAGKCCQAHVFLVQPQLLAAISAPVLSHDSFIARWTNFIAVEPNPPPITAPIA